MSFIERIALASTFVMATATIATGIAHITAQIAELYDSPRELKEVRAKSNQAPKSTLFSRRPSRQGSGLSSKTGVCRICGKRGYTEWHHIISQHHARKTGQRALITNPGNVVEVCKGCHSQTTASKSRYLYEKQRKRKNKWFWRSHQ
jgi:hypothetical protein